MTKVKRLKFLRKKIMVKEKLECLFKFLIYFILTPLLCSFGVIVPLKGVKDNGL